MCFTLKTTELFLQPRAPPSVPAGAEIRTPQVTSCKDAVQDAGETTWRVCSWEKDEKHHHILKVRSVSICQPPIAGLSRPTTEWDSKCCFNTEFVVSLLWMMHGPAQRKKSPEPSSLPSVRGGKDEDFPPKDALLSSKLRLWGPDTSEGLPGQKEQVTCHSPSCSMPTLSKGKRSLLAFARAKGSRALIRFQTSPQRKLKTERQSWEHVCPTPDTRPVVFSTKASTPPALPWQRDQGQHPPETRVSQNQPLCLGRVQTWGQQPPGSHMGLVKHTDPALHGKRCSLYPGILNAMKERRKILRISQRGSVEFKELW